MRIVGINMPGVGELERAREGNRDLDADSMIGTRKRYSRQFLVLPSPGENPCDMNEENAMAAAGIPALRSLGVSAFCISKSAREINSILGLWEVTAVFDSKTPGTASSVDTVDWSWTAETENKVIMFDPVTGKPIVNAVGEPYLIEAPVSIPVYRLSRVVSNFNENELLTYLNKTNSLTFFGAPPGCALMSSIDDAPVVQGGIRLRKVTYVVKFDLSINPLTGTRIGWGVLLNNHGTKYTDGPLIVGQPLPDFYRFVVNGQPTTGNLNYDGTPRDPRLVPLGLYYNRHARVNFNPLALGPY